MVKTIRTFFLSLTILAFLLFSTVGTTTVFADDGTGTEASATETPTPAEETQPAEETLPLEETAPAENLETILEQVPENTTVTVLNSEGEALPLASQESADAIASDYDPIWCPTGQVPTPGANGCTQSFGSFDELLTYLQTNEGDAAYQQAGTIYIQQGAYLGGESSIDFNNYEFNSFNQNDLTLQGGWDTTYDPATGAPTFTTTSFNAPIIIGSSTNPWAGSLTLNNISIDGVSSQTGLTLYSEGDINLDTVEVTNSQSGADLNAGGNVKVNKSKFNNNGSNDLGNPIGKGLEVVSAGKVTLTSVSANNNQLFGANVDAVGNITITNSFFNSNQGIIYQYVWDYKGYGLQVTTGADIELDGVTANDNYLYGADLAGRIIKVSNSFFSENESDWHEGSIGSGLKVVSTGNVTLASVAANDNERFGADIQSTDGAVTVTNSFFNGNQSYSYSLDGIKSYHGYGLKIVTNREVSLVNVEAMENDLFGAHIESKDVAIDTANFSNNGSGSGLDLTGYGLEVISQNEVALAAVTANNNQLFGANILAGDLVAISQSQFNGHLTYVYDYFTNEILSRSGGYGLRVVTLGNIAMNQITADNNYLYGTYLKGDDTTVNKSFFIANGSGLITEPSGSGLQIVSTGKVNLTAVDASNNQLFGADIQAVDTVNIFNSFFSGHQSVTFTPSLGLTFYGYGLNVVTQDDIFLNFVIANYNNLWGASLTGDDVAVYNSQFNNNISDSTIFIDDTGLLVNAAGDVDIFKVEAKENRLIGATITAKGDVFVADSNFVFNQGFTCLQVWCPSDSIVYHGLGLQVTTPGLIQVTGTDASNNNLYGAELNGALVTVENSTFNNNGMGNGLTVNASNNVTLTNVTALNNGGNGVDVTGVCQKIVMVTGGTFSDNTLYGLSVLFATLNLDGTQIFANNGSGNIFINTSTCLVVIPT